jgi:flagellar biosynthesis protein FlhG
MVGERSKSSEKKAGRPIPDQADKLRRLVEQVTPRKPHKARRIAFLSGKGGVGKTSIAVNVALAMARMGRKTILVDCDLGLANADVLLGIQPRATLDGIFMSGKDISRAIVNLPSGLWLIPGAGAIVPRQAVNSGKLEEVLDRIDNDAEFILLDAAAGIDEGVQHVAKLSDEVVVVAVPENAATLNAYRLIKVILDMRPAPAVRLVVNRAGSSGAAKRVASGLIGAAREFLSNDPEYLGWIPVDPIVEQAGRERRPLVERYPGSLPSRAIVALAQRLIQPPPHPPTAA